MNTYINSNYALKETYTTKYLGNKNKTSYKSFIKLCKMPQNKLKEHLVNFLKSFYSDVVVADGFVYAEGSIPVGVTAHMDTVHEQIVKDYYDFTTANNEHIISSPQGIGGDDRCGIYMIKQLLLGGYRPTVIFCEDEEIGSVGAEKLVSKHVDVVDKLGKLKYIIELDRANSNDAVFYSCDNPKFTKYILETTGYKKNYGSWSDICTLSPSSGVASVNLSCGYYHAHTLSETVNMNEMFKTIDVVKKLFNDIDNAENYEFIQKKFESYSYGGGYYGAYGYGGGYYDDEDDFERYYGLGKYRDGNLSTKKQNYYWFKFIENGSSSEDWEVAANQDEAIGKFVVDHPTVTYDDIHAIEES